MTIAQTILTQLGGNRFVAMTGANNLLNTGKGLSMKIGRNAKGVTHFRVILDEARDLYNLEFLKIRGTNIKTVTKAEGVYFDQLQEIFTTETGLDTHL